MAQTRGEKLRDLCPRQVTLGGAPLSLQSPDNEDLYKKMKRFGITCECLDNQRRFSTGKIPAGSDRTQTLTVREQYCIESIT